MDFFYLIVIGVGLVISWWPVGHWHLWSWMWAVILSTVLIFEVIAAYFSPEKRTISNQMREYRKSHPYMFWALQIPLWLALGYALTAHLAN